MTIVEPPKRGGQGGAVVAVLAVLAYLLAIILHLTSRTTDITPDHDEVVLSLSAVAAVVGAATALALILRYQVPLRGPRLLSVPVVTLLAGVMAGLLSASGLTDSLLQAVRFAGPVTRHEQAFLIDRAYVSQVKGTHYHIQVFDPFADLELDPQEYVRLFGGAREYRPANYCLWATVEQKGKAVRLLVSSVMPIPMGHVRPCPSGSAGPPDPPGSEFYPNKAVAKNVEGLVILKCVVASDYHLLSCAVASEQPTGYGFGDAALKVASTTVLGEKDRVKAQPGSMINLPIHFALPKL